MAQPSNRVAYGFIALINLLAASLSAGCSRSSDSGVGSARVGAEPGAVALALTLPGGAVLDQVDYEITGNGIAPITGRVNVMQSGEVSFVVGAIPAGLQYRVVLSATSRDLGVACTGGADFDIISGALTSVQIALQCSAREDMGSVLVNGVTNNCPVISALSVAPLEVGPAGTIGLAATTRDVDPGSHVAVTWMVLPNGGGSFADKTATSTTFTCAGQGSRFLHLVVSDRDCEVRKTVTVACGPAPDTSACRSCISAACPAEARGCSVLTDLDQRRRCTELLTCIRATDCGRVSLSICWCGQASPPTCSSVPGAANGPCLVEEVAASGVTDLSQPSVIIDRPTPATRAHDVVACEREFCPVECGYTPPPPGVPPDARLD